MKPIDIPALTPGQADTLAALEQEFQHSACVSLEGRGGSGKTLLATIFARRHGARHVNLEDYVKLASPMPAEKWRDRISDFLLEYLNRHSTLVVDDWSYVHSAHWTWADQLREHLFEEAQRLGRKLLLVSRLRHLGAEHDEDVLAALAAKPVKYDRNVPTVTLPAVLQPEDLAALAEGILGADTVAQIDCDVVQLHAASLMPREWILACRLLLDQGGVIDTRRAMDVIDKYILHENIQLAQVETLSFDSLPGTEAIQEALEKHLVMPFEHPGEALRLGIKARRGVMLFGPPGTGKTSIGRALAHRLKSKFYLIDGSIATEPPHIFAARINGLIERAIRNAPSVLFIDDADNLFAIPYAAGIVRKLLSVLDGMESASASKVCVMMTVMDPIHVPDALLRSGRVELWLETKPPVAAVRADMFRRWNGPRLPGQETMDFDLLAARSDGFTPADIRRVMGDARLIYAQDRKNGRLGRGATEYAVQAIDEIVAMRGAMSGFLADDTLALGGGTMGEIAA